MDLLEPSNDFQDWELLQSTTPAHHPINAVAEIDSSPLLHPDYFSLPARNPPPDLDDDNSAASENPSWIDPASDDNPTRYKDPGGFWSDSSSEDAKIETDFPDNNPKYAIPVGMGETLEDAQGLGSFHSAGQIDDVVADNSRVNLAGGNNLHAQREVCGEEETDKKSVGGGDITDEKAGGHLGKRNVVWWKMPVDILRYCVFKMSPVWAVSVAAAVMGFVILGRKLYKMKKKTRGLQIKLTFDDKKISQVMNHANRLNDAFSIVKRVPLIRPSLPPSVGAVTSWPVASLR